MSPLPGEGLALAQMCRECGDAEKALDELENPWGWDGWVTQDLQRTAILARLNARVNNWWSLYVLMIAPEARREAQTSRSQMMDGIARVTHHAPQKRLLLTIAQCGPGGVRAALVAMTRFLREVQDAPHLTLIERWCRIPRSGCCRPEPEPARRGQATTSSRPEDCRRASTAES